MSAVIPPSFVQYFQKSSSHYVFDLAYRPVRALGCLLFEVHLKVFADRNVNKNRSVQVQKPFVRVFEGQDAGHSRKRSKLVNFLK